MTDETSAGRILAVDDDANFRSALNRLLEDSGVDYDIAEDADTAAEMLRSGIFTGVLTDGLEGRWKLVTDTAHEIGAAAVLLSGDDRQIELAEQDGVTGFNKAKVEPNTLRDIIKRLSSKPNAEENDILATVFPDSGEISDEVERLTLGYEDFSDDQLATKLFEAMTERQRDAVHRFALNGPKLMLQHLKLINDLVDGYHKRDPNRTAVSAMEEVLAEIDSSRAYFETVDANDFVPAIVYVRPKDMPDSDTERAVWVVRSSAGEDGATAKQFLPDFDIVENFVRNPVEGYDAWRQSYFNLIGSSFAIIDRSSLIRGSETES